MIVVIDYKMGNVGSILNMLKKIGAPAVASGDPRIIAQATKLVLPGVGAFDRGMQLLLEFGLREVLDQRVLKERIPVLGICLGMQLITRRSEEGQLPGLGWVEADTVRFRVPDRQKQLRVPHMGWNRVTVVRGDSLFRQLEQDSRFYFVHSYHLVCDSDDCVLARTTHGYPFVSSVQKGNVFGTQFHPEKSHKYGLRLLQNFASLN